MERLEERLVGGPVSSGSRPAAVPARLERQLESVQRRLERLQHTVDSLEAVPAAPAKTSSRAASVPLKRGPVRPRGRTTQDVSHQLVKVGFRSRDVGRTLRI